MRSYVLLFAFAILLSPLPALAQSIRHPTDAEIAQLLEEMRQNLSDLIRTGFYSDRRSAYEREQQTAFVDAWATIDATTAPFLGDWAAIEENLLIFPTPTPGEVCIIDSYLDESDFYMGRVLDGKLYTDTNLTLVLDSGFLVSTFVSDQPGHYEYANPRPVDNPQIFAYYADYHPTILEQFDQANCLTEVPE